MVAYLDGNVLAGVLGELLSPDLTRAVAQCAACGGRDAMAQARVYTDGPGMVARCAACDEVLLRVVRGPDRGWLDLRGISCLQVMLADGDPPAAAGTSGPPAPG